MSFRDMLPPRIQQMPAYRYEKPVQELEREIGVPMVQLGLNENPFGPSPKAIAAIRACLQNTDRYPDDTGYFDRLRAANCGSILVSNNPRPIFPSLVGHLTLK